MTFYLKYRPQTIDELDLQQVRESLKNILKSGDLPHAFLFSGPKGTGKTSAARILAKIINCERLTKEGEPCNKCSQCLSITKGNNIDIIELDAASNRGIDDIRSLKEGIFLTPATAKKKVYIIDEAHMLTLEAANAFLKTLEEPPDHVVFILATTNPEKLPATVISRLTQINFTKASTTDIARQLTRVARAEKIKISSKAVELIAKFADGSFRDAVKILESLSLKTKDIKEDDIENVFQNSTSEVTEFFETLVTRDTKKSLSFIEDLVKKGISIKHFTDLLLEAFHKNILEKNDLGEDSLTKFSQEEIVTLFELFVNTKKESSPIAQLPLEIAVIKFISTKGTKDQKDKKAPDSIESESTTQLSPLEDSAPVQKITISSQIMTLDELTWQKLLQAVREKNVSIEALLRAAKPLTFDGKVLSLGVYYRFHKDHLEEAKNIRILEDLCKGILGKETIKIVFELIERPAKTVEKSMAPAENEIGLTGQVDKDIIEAAKEIFS